MKKSIHVIVIFLSLAMAASGLCQIKPGGFSISPFIGGYMFEGNQDLRSQPVYGIRLGYDATKNIGAEILYDYVATKYSGSGYDTSTSVHNVRVEVLYHFMPEERLVPFIAVGTGGQSINYNSGPINKATSVAAFGGGVKYFINDWLALRADVRDVYVFDISKNNLEYTIGLTFLFGGEKSAKSSAKEPEPTSSLTSVRESSSDIAAVQKKEEAPVAVKELEQKKEAAAPVTIVKEEVQKKETAKEAAAVAAVAKEMVEKGRATIHIRFDFDKAVVKPEFHKEIEKFAKVMEQYKELKVVIEGHTDNIGEKDYNQGLSERRANSVKTYLIKTFGVEESRLSSKGYGMSKPIASNKTKAGKQKNRRVEAVVDYTYTITK